MNRSRVVYVVSDSVGETAEFVVRAAASQFDQGHFDIRRISYVDHVEAIEEIVAAAAEVAGFIAYTLILPALRESMREAAARANVRAVDIMGPMMTAFEDVFNALPALRPGLIHQLDDDYFRRVEAIEFAVKYDDGRDSRGLARADVVLIGVSRTSKTPLSMYLAHRRLRVANVPLVPEVQPPEELFALPHGRVIGLTIRAEELNEIRQERLRALGLTESASYASQARILEELRFADDVMRRVGCPVIDVSKLAVEETASKVMTLLEWPKSRAIPYS
ncbi:pyruvate, water dikinase regulatory protein [Ferroacidibacillus organovorans]|uniref:Putative pyruvate, phosphate dikinase regulatory protein n=1 Tax=Ferroacidibacillus organovorans TaxID=1765683 RepID=A0A162TRW0_9BACL|nr:pyruvate, water dikinase regulatory protein [Ferroacidibacillus organovorans]KYP81068.1 phosphoenolpyruvate synthase regulatory protein [Ferroacidibacillus organovorans]OAG93696.1 phosphoenolpyruvate synthase regulatory protein [Ferroacidibacillus organovorans]OPG17483.1 phosphoenolpyruvate synthase regulatory protein [Ferroacidibacillus organovorans]